MTRWKVIPYGIEDEHGKLILFHYRRKGDEVIPQIVRDHNQGEAFEAMREALKKADKVLADDKYPTFSPTRSAIKAALALAEQVDKQA